MTALKLDQLGSQATGRNAAGPIRIDEAILAADDVGPPYVRDLVELTRDGVGGPCLGAEALDRRCGGILVAIRVEDLASKLGVDPPRAAVLVLFEAAPILREEHVGFGELLDQAGPRSRYQRT